MAEADDFGELNMLDERGHILEAPLGESGKECLYEYDFGESWRDRIAVKPLARPMCTGGARAAPPDDVGGPPGYEEFLAAIKDPKHDENENIAYLDRRRVRP